MEVLGMSSKKSFLLTIVLTVLVTCLLTNATRDIMDAKIEGRSMQKISAVKRMLSEYSLFEADEEKIADYASMTLIFKIIIKLAYKERQNNGTAQQIQQVCRC